MPDPLLGLGLSIHGATLVVLEPALKGRIYSMVISVDLKSKVKSDKFARAGDNTCLCRLKAKEERI